MFLVSNFEQCYIWKICSFKTSIYRLKNIQDSLGLVEQSTNYDWHGNSSSQIQHKGVLQRFLNLFLSPWILYFFKYRMYFNRRACVSVCLCSVLQKKSINRFCDYLTIWYFLRRVLSGFIYVHMQNFRSLGENLLGGK